MKRKVCAQGHAFFKSSDCPACPKCEELRKPADGFLSELASPARRALGSAGLTTIEKLASWSEAQVLGLHGMGPNAMTKLRASLEKRGLRFREG